MLRGLRCGMIWHFCGMIARIGVRECGEVIELCAQHSGFWLKPAVKGAITISTIGARCRGSLRNAKGTSTTSQ